MAKHVDNLQDRERDEEEGSVFIDERQWDSESL